MASLNTPYSDNYFSSNMPQATATPAASSSFMGSAALFLPALTSLLGASAAVADINAKKEALIRTMEGDARALKYSQFNKQQKLEDLNRIVGDKLSATGLEALKAESRLKAASAETGASGTTNLDAIATADVNRLHQDAAILREADVAKTNILTELVSERLSFESKNESMLGGLPSTAKSIGTGLSSSLEGFKSGLNFLTDTQKSRLFGA